MATKKPKKKNEPRSIDEAVEVLDRVAAHDESVLKSAIETTKSKIESYADIKGRVKDAVMTVGNKVKENPLPFALGLAGVTALTGYMGYVWYNRLEARS